MNIKNKINEAIRLQRLKQLSNALQIYREVLQIEPQNETAMVNLGITLFQLNQIQSSIQLLQKAVQFHPNSSNAQFNLGYALLQIKKLKEALPHLQQTVKLNSDFFEAYLHLGNTLSSLGDYNQAFENYLQAYKLNPKSLELLNNWTYVCIQLKNYPQAHKILDQALKWFPLQADLYGNRGIIYRNQWQMAKAEEQFLKAISLNNQDSRLMNALGVFYHSWNKYDLAMEYFEKSLALDPQNQIVHSNIIYLKNYFPEYSNEYHLKNHQKWQEKHAPESLALNKSFNFSSVPPLKVGLLSGDFNNHPVTIFLLPWLTNANSQNIQFYAYAEIQHRDEYTEKVKQYCTQWFETTGLQDQEVVEQIAFDGLHILIDLAGHTKGNRLSVMAYKAAPVQISYLGYINTTGLTQIHYRIVDQYVNPPESQKYYTEKLIYLPSSYTCYTPPEYSLKIQDTPSLTNGYITFGSFNNPCKYNEKLAQLWAEILQNVPHSKLMLKARHFGEKEGAEPIVELFSKAGIPKDRLILEGGSSYEEYFKSYNKIDLNLDPFPHNGGTTSHDALYMGVPVISLEGNSYVSRMGVSILTNLGHPEWIAKTPQEYIELAVELSKNVNHLNTIRKKLRAQLLASDLCNGKLFAQRMEKLLYNIAPKIKTL